MPTMGLSLTVSDRRQFQSKIANSPPLYFAPSLKVFPLDLGIGAGGQKTMGLPGRQRSLTISSAIWIECTNVTDRRSPDHSKDRAYMYAYRRVVKINLK